MKENGKQKYKLLGSHGNLKGLIDGIGRFYCLGSGDLITITDKGEVYIKNELIEGVRVVLTKGRYRFERVLYENYQ